MNNAGDLLFAELNIPNIDKEQAVYQINALGDEGRFWDDYRACFMIPLTLRCKEPPDPDNVAFYWASYAPKCISEWFEDHVFPFVGMRSRIMILQTPAGAMNREHIDCERHELNTLQHKFRVVLQGETDSLYYITKQGNVSPPKIDKPFIMDGGWAHGMHNYGNQEKITLALGYPYIGKPVYDDRVNILLNRNDYDMVDNLEPYWK